MVNPKYLLSHGPCAQCVPLIPVTALAHNLRRTNKRGFGCTHSKMPNCRYFNLRGWWKRRSERARRRPSIRCRAEVATDLHARPPARAIGRLRTCRTEMGMILFGSYFAAAREIQRWRAVALAPKRRTEQNSVEPESFPKCRRLKPSLPCPVDSSHMLPVTPLRGPRFAQTAAARCQRR